MIELETTTCPSPRCRRAVTTLLAIGGTGAHKPVVVDPEPTTWTEGGRLRLSEHQPGVGKHPLARELRHAGQAFGASDLYRRHADTCGGGTGRTAPRSREHG